VCTFELDAELIWLGLDPSSIQRPKTLSNGEYGPRRGVRRVLDVLERRGVRASWMIPGRNAEVYPAAVQAIAAAGHELGNHGYLHEDFSLLDGAAQRDAVDRANDSIERLVGVRPVGFRTPAGDMTADTPRLLEELGFTWSSSTRGDDRPSFMLVDGRSSRMVEIPTHWELDDFSAFMFNREPAFPLGQGRIASYASVFDTWVQEFDAYYDLGLCFTPMFHPQTIGTPGRIALLDELIAHAQSRSDVWFATGSEVADWWRASGPENEPNCPAEVFQRGGGPS